MGIFISQNPGVGIFQLTTAEEAFLTSFANLTFSDGEVLTIVGGAPSWEPASGGIPSGAVMWDIPYVDTAGTALTTAQSPSDGIFRVQLLGAGEVMLDMFSANSVQSGVASFLVGDAGKVITFGSPSGQQAELYIGSDFTGVGQPGSLGSFGVDGSTGVFSIKQGIGKTDWLRVLGMDKDGYIRNPLFFYDGTSALAFDSGTGGFSMGDLTGAGDNLQIQVSGGQILFGSFTNSDFFYYDGTTSTMSFQFAGASAMNISQSMVALVDATNMSIGTTTGSKIGTATNQKIGFWNATPIIQPTTGVGSATFTANTSANIVYKESTFDGYTISQVVKALRNMGALA